MTPGEPIQPPARTGTIEFCQESLRHNPRQPEVLRQLAGLLAAQKKFDEALPHLWAALAMNPMGVPVLNDLGNTLVNARRPEEAIPLFLHAIDLVPAETCLHNNLALAYTESGMFDHAFASFQSALALAPGSLAAHGNLGSLLIMMARHREALACFQRALQLDPAYPHARRNRALAHLSLGEFEKGWQDYDWCAFGMPQPPDPFPRWNGQPLAGSRVLLTAHQGLGDILHFIRYAPQLKALGAHVILECPEPLMLVLDAAPGIDQLLPQGAALPQADVSVPLMALARIFNTALATIPAPVPYLSPDPQRVAVWRNRLGAPGPGERRVGICWQGNPHHQWDRFRSVPLERFAPLAKIAGVRLFSLQRGPGVEQIDAFQRLTQDALLVPTHGRQDSPQDLADSAALMSLLDLTITIDSAPAHLAGALGRPVWVPLSLTADWRWLTERADTPWYSTMRLYRQTTAGNWDAVFHRLAADLAAWVASA